MTKRELKRRRRLAIELWTKWFADRGELKPRAAATNVVDFELEHAVELSLDRLILAGREELGDRR